MIAAPRTTCLAAARRAVRAVAVSRAEPDTVARIQAAHAPWWVLQTRARHEKCVAEFLAERGVSHYLPLVAVHRTYPKRKVTFYLPLFPGYVFLAGDAGACELARRSNRVTSVLAVTDQEQLRQELIQVARALACGDAVQLHTGLQVGRRCRITRGPLQGVEGTVVREGRRCQFCLAVTMVGQSAMVEVDAALLEALD